MRRLFLDRGHALAGRLYVNTTLGYFVSSDKVNRVRRFAIGRAQQPLIHTHDDHLRHWSRNLRSGSCLCATLPSFHCGTISGGRPCVPPAGLSAMHHPDTFTADVVLRLTSTSSHRLRPRSDSSSRTGQLHRRTPRAGPTGGHGRATSRRLPPELCSE
jgi:hypothetical protein